MNKTTSTPIMLIILLLLGGVGVFLYMVKDSLSTPKYEVIQFSGRTMGTTYQVQITDVEMTPEDLTSLQAVIDAELVAVNDAMSTYLPESEISRFNRFAEVGVVFPVSERFQEVMARSMEIFRESAGAFDPTLGPLIDLWGFGAAVRGGRVPTEEQIQTEREKMGLQQIALSVDGLTKNAPGLEINLSAIAKGYAVDRVMALLSDQGYRGVYVEIGGEVSARGVNGWDGPWRLGIQVPLREENMAALEVVRLEDRAMATSGDYRNYIEDAQGLRHHILDPRTGRPAEHTLASVTVLADDCMTADAIATVLYVMGTQEGMAWLESRPEIDAFFIDRVNDRFLVNHTPGFHDILVPLP